MNWKLIRKIDLYFGIPLIWLLSWIHPSPQAASAAPPTPPSRILLIKFWGIGNLFMLLPSIKSIRDRYPEASIDFLTLVGNRSALAMTETVSTIITIDTASTTTFLRSCTHALRMLRAARYDLVIDFEQFARISALMAWQTRAPVSIGYRTQGQSRHLLYTDPVPYDNEVHITRSFYHLVTKAGVTMPLSTGHLLGHPEEWQEKGGRMLKNHAIPVEPPLAVLHIGTSDNFRERRWPGRSFAALADYLIERHGFQVILTGLPDENHLLEQTAAMIDNRDRVINLGGRLSFTDYFSLISVADLIISADTAAVHLASAINKPVVGIYGPNTPRLYGPWGEHGSALYAAYDCSPCITNFNGKINTCRHPHGRGACMAAISPDVVRTHLEREYLASDAPHRLARLKVLQP